MCVKVFSVDASCRLQDISRVCYVELLDKNGAKVQAKIGLAGGVGHAVVDVPFATPSGIYQLVAYTRWMRNEGSRVFARKPIAVFNSLKATAADRQKLVEEGGRENASPSSSPSSLRVRTDKPVYACRSKVEIRLDSIPRGASLFVSVTKAGCGSAFFFRNRP